MNNSSGMSLIAALVLEIIRLYELKQSSKTDFCRVRALAHHHLTIRIAHLFGGTGQIRLWVFATFRCARRAPYNLTCKIPVQFLHSRMNHIIMPVSFSNPMKSTAPRSTVRIWAKRLLGLFLLILIPASVYLYYYGPWIAYLLATGPLGGATLVETDASCGDGAYRIEVYQYKSGDGYLALSNREGKVFASAQYANGIDYGPFRWKPDCKKVMVGSNEGLVFLEAK